MKVQDQLNSLLLNDAEVKSDINTVKNEEKAQQTKKSCLPFKGYLLAILSAFLFCLSSVSLRMLNTLTPSDNAFINYVVWGIVVFIIAKYNKVNVFGSNEQRNLLHARGAIGVVALLSIYTSLTLIDPSDVVSITHASLIITTILARIFLKEKLTIAHFVSTILTIIGILFICKPTFLFKEKNSPFNSTYLNLNLSASNFNHTNEKSEVSTSNMNTFIGVSITLLGAFALGIVQIVMKKLCIQKCHYSVLTLYAVYYGAPISLLISIGFFLSGKSHVNNELSKVSLHVFFSIGVGLLGVCAQIALNLSFNYEDATKVAIIRTTGNCTKTFF